MKNAWNESCRILSLEQLSYSKFFNCNTNFREKSSQTSVSLTTLSLPSPISRYSRVELAGRVADDACHPTPLQAEDADRPPTIQAAPSPCLVATATRTPCRVCTAASPRACRPPRAPSSASSLRPPLQCRPAPHLHTQRPSTSPPHHDQRIWGAKFLN